MGELSDTLNEFQNTSKKYYQKVMNILESKYCWKCPMRTNREEMLCQEVEAWIRLTEALEGGVLKGVRHENFSPEKLEIITAKFLEKKMKKSHTGEKEVLVKLEDDAKPFATSGDFLYIKTHPLKVKKGDLVLLPRVCPLTIFWYKETTENAVVPFKIFKISRVFHKKGVRYIKTLDGLEVPVEFLMGVIINIIGEKSFLNKKRIK